MATLELRSKEIAEEVVVAVPLAAIVERDDERVRACQGLERIGGVLRAKHRVAEGRRHPSQDRGGEQECPQILRLASQDLVEEVVRDLGLRAGQSGGAGGCVVAVAGRECCQRDPCRPSLRSLAQSLGLLLGELETAEGSNGSRLLAVEGEQRVPTSVRSPPARRRPRRIPGSPRVTSTSWEPAGTCSARNARIERLLLAVIRCTSSSTSKNGSRSLRSAARRGRAASTILGVRRDSSSRRSPRRGPVRSRAATMRASSTTGSLSPRASCTQPPGRGSRALHCATSVDLPYPAGAETSTTRLRCAASRSGARRGRGTASERTGGTMTAGASSSR